MAEHQRTFSVSPQAYPFADHWLERGGAAMHFVDEGRGVPVLMLHGNPTWSYLYRDVIKSLREECRCVAPDYPGFGFSDHPAGYGYTPQEHAAWIKALIDDLAFEKYVLVAQDWGGPIGLSVAVEQPERVAGLVLLNTWAWPATAGPWIFSKVMGNNAARYLHLRRNFFARRLVPAGILRRDEHTAENLRAYTDPFPTPASRTGTWVFPRAISAERAWLAALESSLGRLRDKPVEMVWAMRDMAFGRESYIERWQRHFPGAPVDRIANASHYLQEDVPERIAAAIRRLLARLAPSPESRRVH